MERMPLKIDKKSLESLYHRLNRRRFVHPDPLEFLYDYRPIKDREIVGLVASSLAYGTVKRILTSVSHVLKIMGPSPAAFLRAATLESLLKDFNGFIHRFATGEDLSMMLMGAKRVIAEYGSLCNCLTSGLRTEDQTLVPALNRFAREIAAWDADKSPGHLIPLPDRGSACKRLNLFLRWMVRRDGVDPGGWDTVPVSKLIVPLDTHMFKVGHAFGMTSRKRPDMRTALEVTEGFRRIEPDDPVKYDFSLTRLGIRKDQSMDIFFGSLDA